MIFYLSIYMIKEENKNTIVERKPFSVHSRIRLKKDSKLSVVIFFAARKNNFCITSKAFFITRQ